MCDRRLDEAIRLLDPPAGTRPWHGGASVLGALRGVSPDVAFWRPFPDRHSIWALALHVAYWDYGVWRRLTDGPDPPARPAKAAWNEDRRLVRHWHDRVVDALSSFDPARLDDPAGEGAKTTYADLVSGIVLHETYHAGQIQMLKRLAKSAAEGPMLVIGPARRANPPAAKPLSPPRRRADPPDGHR